MNKQELIEKVAEKTGASKKGAELCVAAVFDVIQEALVEGEPVRLIGFGTFETKKRSARTGRNPQDPDKTIMIPESKAPTFKAGKSLKAAVNK